MTGPEHYREAERLAELAGSPAGLALAQDGYDVAGTAQAHAALAAAAATIEMALAMQADNGVTVEWIEAVTT